MLWLDYREKLGIGFNDDQKFKLLQTKIINTLKTQVIPYENAPFLSFCIMVGVPYERAPIPLDRIRSILSNAKTINEFLTLYIAFVNTFDEYTFFEWGTRVT